ncbi:hypothetical protein SLEP1_g58460 [Rubroshorea leprosula]|uniref:Uncharacterized protein n=1 Tax=Rubroshorea leprosula TaxID=152421 RepID=A0AAV5MPJ3_9ROSI|nr:hypothetical protein SLEP1_g58460 [Rubroshorea leprosula]
MESKAGFIGTQLGLVEPAVGFDETQPCWVRAKPSKGRNPTLLGSGKPSQARVGFRETQPGWVRRTQPGWVSSQLNKGDPALLGSTEPSRSGFCRTQPGWVSSNPAMLGSDETQQAGFDAAMECSLVETQGREERKRKKEGEEEGLGG